jgi:hypothetical protein
MSTTTLPSSGKIDGPPPVPIWRFTVERYQQLGEIGVLSENDRVELLEGWIVPKMVHNPPHDSTVHVVSETLSRFISTDLVCPHSIDCPDERQRTGTRRRNRPRQSP